MRISHHVSFSVGWTFCFRCYHSILRTTSDTLLCTCCVCLWVQCMCSWHSQTFWSHDVMSGCCFLVDFSVRSRLKTLILDCKSYSFSHLTDLLWSTDADCRELEVKHCIVSPESSRQSPGWWGQTNSSSRSTDVPSTWQQTCSLQRWGMCMFTGTYCGNMSGLCVCGCVCTQTFTVLHMSCVLVIQQYRKMRQHERWMQFSPVLRGQRWLLREGWEHAEVSKVLDVVVGCSLGGISSHG